MESVYRKTYTKPLRTDAVLLLHNGKRGGAVAGRVQSPLASKRPGESSGSVGRNRNCAEQGCGEKGLEGLDCRLSVCRQPGGGKLRDVHASTVS